MYRREEKREVEEEEGKRNEELVCTKCLYMAM